MTATMRVFSSAAMRHRARLLHLLASAPIAVVMTVGFAPSAHALELGARPAPFVVAVDAGHGGTPDNNHPEVPFDPGVIGPTGLLEKDVTLGVANDLEGLLQADEVRVVMTRTNDRFVSIGDRMQTAIDRGASLFVSIHMNSFPDANTGGTTVLYPGDASAPFATVMSNEVANQVAPLHVANDGIQLKDDLWVHATMPAVTVECAYLSNPVEEALMRMDSARTLFARGIVAGIETQAPQILALKRSLVAWDAAHRHVASAGSVSASATAVLTEAGGHAVRNLVLFVLAMAVWWQRRFVLHTGWRLIRLVWRLSAVGVTAVMAGTEKHHHRRSARERRRQRLSRGRRQALLDRSQQPAPKRQLARNRASYQSVYDELRL